MLSSRSDSAEMRHPVSNKGIAFGGLFTSGIKSAYDIETSGWMALNQGTGTAGHTHCGRRKKKLLLV